MEVFTSEEIKKLLLAFSANDDSEENTESNCFTIPNNISGELNYKGSVIIEGRVLPGSVINISGSLIVKKGISGAIINTGEDVKTPYIEMSRIISEGDLLVTSYLLSCNVLCSGNIFCSSGSVINGGFYSAFYSIQADFLGSSMGSETNLNLIRSHSSLNKDFNPVDIADKYLHQIVALQKVWKGTEIDIYGDTYSFRGNKEGITIIGNSKVGESL